MSAVQSGRVVYAVTKYDQRGASSRVRFKNLVPELERRGWSIRHFPLLPDDLLAKYYQTRRHDYGEIARNYLRFLGRVKSAPSPALWWIEKELLAGLPSLAESLLMPVLQRAVIDYDDGVYLDFNDGRLGRLGRAAKFPHYAQRAVHITVGSEALQQQFRGWGANRLTKIPSTVLVGKYPQHVHVRAPVVTIGWIGTPMTAPFLEPMRPVLLALARRQKIRFCVIGAKWECPGVEVVALPWSEATEAELVGTFDVGIMPLIDGPWERAKCGYKLIQYMAAGVVPVGSRVGENSFIIDEGKNGLLATTADEWLAQLDLLCADPELRARLGAAARTKAAASYDVGCAARAVDAVFTAVVGAPA